ncbi:hypothetical protein F3I62_16715 [Pseudomonas sp. R-28-1W-6]|uniref:hypothetical protein n=1 Tax=Pseudomonas sp. R-28-1W-6 TaxID=2650101 RepID=UPI0013663A39|nr:hypothetical protein [Pseudomonas sp. R-28-1W-6]MWV13744.1 hypothetical protein [Pseudomonas sp. R-28-1W-6]
MSRSFYLARCLIALMGEWSIPIVIGIALGTVLSTWQLVEVADLIESTFSHSMQSVVESCAASTDPPDNSSPPASGTGSPVADAGGETG